MSAPAAIDGCAVDHDRSVVVRCADDKNLLRGGGVFSGGIADEEFGHGWAGKGKADGGDGGDRHGGMVQSIA